MEELLDQQQKLLMKRSGLHAKIGARKIPKIPEPPKVFAAWDYILEEMKWMAHDFLEERKHKQILALVLVTEHKENERFKLQTLQDSLRRTQKKAKRLSDAVQQCFTTLDDGVRVDEEEDIPLRNGDKDLSPPVANYILRMARKHGYSSDTRNPKEKEDTTAPASVEENAIDQGSTCEDVPMVSVQNLLFYDIDDVTRGEAEFRTHCESLSLEDVDIYSPPQPTSVLVDVELEMWEKEKSVYDLLPDAEEFMLLKNSKSQEDASEQLPRLMRFQSEIHDFSNTPKMNRPWQIFQDMFLERYICEGGGHWDLVADLLNVNPLTKGGCFSMKECKDRWLALQKRKGRSVESAYVPQPVLQLNLKLVTESPAKFSLFPLKFEESEVVQKTEISPVTKEPQVTEKPFQFLVSNCSFESNSYFYNYGEINSKFYPEDPEAKFSFLTKPANSSLRTLFSRSEMTPVTCTGIVKDPCDVVIQSVPVVQRREPVIQSPPVPRAPQRLPPSRGGGGSSHPNVNSGIILPSQLQAQHAGAKTAGSAPSRSQQK